MPRPRSFGARWASAFGLGIDPTAADAPGKSDCAPESHRLLAAHRARYNRLKDALVFKIDAAGAADPLSAFAAEQQRLSDAGERSDGAASTAVRSVAMDQPASAAGSPHRRTGGPPSAQSACTDAEGWAQYFTDENLLSEINTDLDRLYPTGNEGFFQRAEYLCVLRHVLFVWCKLHADVSYRQGMHDVAAIVMYAFLSACDGGSGGGAASAAGESTAAGPPPSPAAATTAATTTVASASPSAPLPASIEADTFMVFEAVMLFLKPFYEVAKASAVHDELECEAASSTKEDEPRLFGSCSPSEQPDETAELFGAGVSSLFPASMVASAGGAGGRGESANSGDRSQASSAKARPQSPAGRGAVPPKPALHRLCQHVQFELLQQKDPQLYYHLKNLDIVPETYCLRWIRLLFAREFSLDDVLLVWDAMIVDDRRDPVVFPDVSRLLDDEDTSTPLEDGKDADRALLRLLPEVQRSSDDARWHGFPLLRFLCVAKLLGLAPTLRQSDNTGCLRLLMHSGSGGVPGCGGDDADGEDDSELARRKEREDRKVKTVSLLKFARLLRDPMLEESGYVGTIGSINDEHVSVGSDPLADTNSSADGNSNEDLGAVEVVEFQSSALGIVLTAARAPHEGRLAVKSFTEDPASVDGVGPAQRSGKVKVGDVLQSINGVPIVGMATEEVKRHIQLVGRPLFIGFRRCFGDISEFVDEIAQRQDDPLKAEPQDAVDAVAEHFLPGEMCYAHIDTSVQRFTLSPDGSCLSHYISGKLYITNYRCFFTRVVGSGEIDWQVPILAIASIDGADMHSGMDGGNANSVHTRIDPTGFSRSKNHYLFKTAIRCKDTQVVRLSFSNHSEYSKLVKCLNWLAFPTNLLDAFCFAYSPTVAPSDEVPFDLRLEYRRIGLFDVPNRLRCIDQSPRYDLCDTYPQHVVVPSDVSDARIKAAAAFRAHNRLPVVSWIHRGNGATICRSSQPLVGLKSARSPEDELLVRLLCTSASQSVFGQYVIMDARSQLAAVGNKAMGKGTEVASNYGGCKLVFMGIDNIHAIRQSLHALAAVFEPRQGMLEDVASSASLYGKIESSGWMKHVRMTLKASVELALSVHNGVSVLTHCSDGWDRTAQMVSLAELMLDPFYRTLRGFQVLIEKEWCSFGHQFATRCGHARSDVSNDQRSPVFLLWLDCVWQYVRQFPTECEFNDKLLLALADHVYSCKFGTFMFDCERQRKEYFAKYRVYSIWSAINASSERFTNELYTPSDSPVSLLAPSTLSKNIKLWKGYFCRWDSTMVPPVPAFQYY